MSKKKIRELLYLAGLVVFAAPPACHGQEAQQSAGSAGSVAGQWALNRALSDDPTDQLMNVRGGAVPPSGTGRPAPSQGGSSFDVIRRAVEGFGVRQTDSTVTIAYPDRELELFTDGRKQKFTAPDGREVEYRTLWEGPSLVIERRLDGGLTLTEKYSLYAGTGRLHVLTRLAGDRLPTPISFMRVYDPAPAGAQEPEAGEEQESVENPEAPAD